MEALGRDVGNEPSVIIAVVRTEYSGERKLVMHANAVGFWQQYVPA